MKFCPQKASRRSSVQVTISDPNFGSFKLMGLGGSAGTLLGQGDADSALLGWQLELELTVKKEEAGCQGRGPCKEIWLNPSSVAVHCPQRRLFVHGPLLKLPQKDFPSSQCSVLARASRCRI